MSFIVEDGTSKTDATSYISVADADAYIAVYTTRIGWTSATTSAKELALQRATQYLDSYYGVRYKGIRTDRDQSLMWPRMNVVDLSGYTYDSDDMPSSLLNATAEIADRIVAGDNPLADQSDTAKIKSQKVVVGPIEESVEYIGGMLLGKQYPNVEGILRPILESMSVMKLVRA